MTTDWDRKTIGGFVALQRGYDLTAEERQPGSVPVMGAAGQNGFHSQSLAPAPGIVIGRSGGSFGKVHFAKDDFWPHNTAMFVTDFKGNDPDFAYYFLKNLDFNRLNSGSAQPSLNRNYVYPLIIRVPKAGEQQRISQILRAFDAKIELNQRINAELEALAKTIYDYWFVQFDFPDADGRPYKSSGGKMVWNEALKREIPAGWGNGIAADLLTFNPKETLARSTAAPSFDMASLPTNGWLTGPPQNGKFTGGAKFRNGDVAIAKITPCLENGKTALITRLPEGQVGFGSTEFIIARGKKQSLSAFTIQLARSPHFRKFAILNMTGTSGRKRIEPHILETYSMPIPPDTLLGKFEDIVHPMVQRSTRCLNEADELDKLRDWLLPMLMNGQVRVI